LSGSGVQMMLTEINLDSSIIISNLTEDQHSEHVIKAISKLRSWNTKIFVSLVTYSEIWTGIELIDDATEKSRSIIDLNSMLRSIDARVVSDNILIARRAAKAQAEYRRRGGKRDILIPDFLIGANAEFYSKRLLTTNPRDFMGYFPEVEVITPKILFQNY